MKLNDTSLLPPEGMPKEVGLHCSLVSCSIQLMLIDAIEFPMLSRCFQQIL